MRKLKEIKEFLAVIDSSEIFFRIHRFMVNINWQKELDWSLWNFFRRKVPVWWEPTLDWEVVLVLHLRIHHHSNDLSVLRQLQDVESFASSRVNVCKVHEHLAHPVSRSYSLSNPQCSEPCSGHRQSRHETVWCWMENEERRNRNALHRN